MREVTLAEVARAVGRTAASIRMHHRVLKLMLACEDLCTKEFPHAKDLCTKLCIDYLRR